MQSLLTCIVAGSHYLIHPQILGTIEETIKPEAIVPVTLLTTSEIFGDVDSLLYLYDTYDDVFIPEFGSFLIEKPGGDDSSALYASNASLAQSLHRLSITTSMNDASDLPSGPYFLHGPNLHQAWKLYDDELDAFAFGVIPERVNDATVFRELNSLSSSALYKSIAVPSRLYTPRPTAEKPLSGLRVSIPDTMSLAEVHSTLSSRAWTSLYTDGATSTAPFAQTLIDMGAVIVGKTKVSQLSTGKQWVDISSPWSARGDGYGATSGNLAGAANALAGYPWLHRAVGHDAIGQDLQDSASQGIYTLRSTPSRHALDGVQGTSPKFETLTLSARGINEVYFTAETALNRSDDPIFPPERLIYPVDLFSSLSDEEYTLTTTLIGMLEHSVRLKAEPVNLTHTWHLDPPGAARGLSLHAYMKEVLFKASSFDYYRTYDDFRVAYDSVFHEKPYLEDEPEYRWNTARNITLRDLQEYMTRINAFRQWFSDHVMPIEPSDDTGSFLILPSIFPSGIMRDHPPEPSSPVHGIPPESLSVILQVPQMVFPYAQTPTKSHITGKREFAPVSASIVGPRHSDMSLLYFSSRALILAGWRPTVDTGRLCFPIGNNERNVDDHSRGQSESEHCPNQTPPLQVQMSDEL